MNKNLYFIAILPPPNIIDAITHFKEYAAEHFNSRHAFRSPAHITLQPPFNWATAQLDDLKQAIFDFSKQKTAFSVQFNNFNCFEPRVIYVDVIKTPPLDQLRWDLMNMLFEKFQLRKDKYPVFHPHATIAYRDLTEEMFYTAWEYFSKETYEATFEVEAITLLEHHAGSGWKVESQFEFISD